MIHSVNNCLLLIRYWNKKYHDNEHTFLHYLFIYFNHFSLDNYALFIRNKEFGAEVYWFKSARLKPSHYVMFTGFRCTLTRIHDAFLLELQIWRLKYALGLIKTVSFSLHLLFIINASFSTIPTFFFSFM